MVKALKARKICHMRGHQWGPASGWTTEGLYYSTCQTCGKGRWRHGGQIAPVLQDEEGDIWLHRIYVAAFCVAVVVLAALVVLSIINP